MRPFSGGFQGGVRVKFYGFNLRLLIVLLLLSRPEEEEGRRENFRKSGIEINYHHHLVKRPQADFGGDSFVPFVVWREKRRHIKFHLQFAGCECVRVLG